MNAYFVNDIDEYMDDICFRASQFGWSVFLVSEEMNWRLVTEPTFFPEKQEEILASVRKALERDCAKTCKLCYSAHPMLQIGNYEFCKLCTVQVMKVFPKLFKKARG